MTVLRAGYQDYHTTSTTSTTATTARERLSGLVVISAWIFLSSNVILFNKYILVRFPFSITLTTWHMLFATVATQVLARTTHLIDRNKSVDVGVYLRAIVPIGMFYSMSLILSNMTYLYLSMSFIQMLKAMGPVATLLACWSIGIRNPEPSIRVLLTICVIVIGVAISSFGELQIVVMGVVTQTAAVVCDAYKNALQQYLLGGKLKMGSLTLLYYFAPVCTAINACYILIFEAAALRVDHTHHIGLWTLLANGVLTFGLNIASVAVIEKTSSVVLTLSGIPKSMMLLGIDVAVYRSPITWLQAVGFSIAGAGTYHYSRLESPIPSQLSQKIRDVEYQDVGDGVLEKHG